VKAKINLNSSKGFSLIEMLITMTIMLVILGIASTLLGRGLMINSRERQRSDAISSARAALDSVSRELANAGFGLKDSVTGAGINGIIPADSSSNKVRFRSNFINDTTTTAGEDVTYFWDGTSNSILRYDRITNSTTIIINRISTVTFQYFDYSGGSSVPTSVTTPTLNTGRVRITITVNLDPVPNMPAQSVILTSDVTLRNSSYMLNQY
jgi:prepilin-type N-terminal cleavage/methylation domain-containing protein